MNEPGRWREIPIIPDWLRARHSDSAEVLFPGEQRMPMEPVDEEGLPKNPDLQLVQWRFLLSVDESVGINKNAVWEQLLEAIKENGLS